MVPRKKIVPISENAAYRVFLRKGKHIRYRTKALGDKELEYRPRVYGKSFKQWQQFIAYSRRGEDIVYRTPEGDICSPARVERLITASNKQLLRELEGQKQENRNARIEELEWAEHNADDVNFSIRERINKLSNED